MVVEALVSSMKTSRFRSSVGCSFRKVLRAAATSGRSCSAACRLFFKGQVHTQKPEDRRLADCHLVLGQVALNFQQRDVRLFRYQLPDPIGMRLKNMLLVSAEFIGPNTARFALAPNQPAHGTQAQPKNLRN